MPKKEPTSPLRPTIVCLCGSTRFIDEFHRANCRETMAGKIVLSIACDTKSASGRVFTDEEKAALDELHKRKIDMADEVLFLNVGNYMGESTQSELEYAKSQGKALRFLEPRSDLVDR